MDTIEATRPGTRAPAGTDPAEWAVRVDLAACYRLIAHYGWDDLIFTHISARVPNSDHHFLINPEGFRFNEITASNLLKIDCDGKLVTPSPNKPIFAGFVIHSALHMSRDDAQCVLHTHTEANIAVGAQEQGLLPLSQFAMRFYNRVGYHDYEGPANDLDERQRLIRDAADHPLLVLRNHGILAIGRSVAEAFVLQYYFERASRTQLQIQIAAAAGAKIVMPSPETCAQAARNYTQPNGKMRPSGAREWPAMVRLVEKLDPSYAT